MINFEQTANAWGWPIEEVKKFFNDGRIMGRWGEFDYAIKNDFKRAKSEKSPYDVIGNGSRIEVRSLTKRVSFAASKEVGIGRKVTDEGYKEKLNNVDYFIVIEYDFFTDPLIYKEHTITKDDLIKIELMGKLTKNKSVTRKNFLKYVNDRRLNEQNIQ